MTLKTNTTTFNKNLKDHQRRTARDEQLTPDVRKSLKGAPAIDADSSDLELNQSSLPRQRSTPSAATGDRGNDASSDI